VIKAIANYAPVCIHHIPERISAVPDPADDRQDGPLLAWRIRGGLAIRRAEENGVNLITRYCMFMFLPKSPRFLKFHSGLLKIIGKYLGVFARERSSF
jgi:hypothetical protein